MKDKNKGCSQAGHRDGRSQRRIAIDGSHDRRRSKQPLPMGNSRSKKYDDDDTLVVQTVSPQWDISRQY